MSFFDELKNRIASGAKAGEKAYLATDEAKSKVASSNYKGDLSTVKSAVKNAAQPAISLYEKYKSSQSDGSWYSGDTPTRRETLARIYELGKRDESKREALMQAYQQELNNPLSPIYNPYDAATSQKQTKTTLANTQKAMNEWAALADELTYWAGRTDLNLSDDDILARVDWDNYKTLQKMDEGRLSGSPLELLAPVGYSEDAMRGVLWAARNPESSTGDAMMDAVQSAMGRGRAYVRDDIRAAQLDPSSQSYNPYAVSGTMLDLERKYGTAGFDADWLEQNMGMRGNTDYAKVYNAEQFTAEAEAELEEFNRILEEELTARPTQDVDKLVSYLFDEGNFKALAKLDESLKSGKLLDTTRAIHYDRQAIEQGVREYVALSQARANASKDPDAMAASVEAEKAAVVNEKGMLSEKETIPQSQTNKTESVFDIDVSKAFQDALVWAGTNLPHRSKSGDLKAWENQYDYVENAKDNQELSAPNRLIGRYADWTDEQKEAGQDYIYASHGGYTVDNEVLALKEAGLTDEKVNAFRSEVSEALASADYTDDHSYAWFDPTEEVPVQSVAEERNTTRDLQLLIESGNYEEAAKVQYNAVSRMLESADEEAALEILHSEDSQKSAATLLSLAVNGGMMKKVDDPQVKEQLQIYEKYAKEALAIEEEPLNSFIEKLDSLLNMNGALVKAQNNDGLGLNTTLQLIFDSTMTRGAQFVDDLIGSALIAVGGAVGSEKLTATGETIAADMDSTAAHYHQLVRDNGTPLEIMAVQYGSEIAHQLQLGSAASGLMRFSNAKFGESLKFLQRMISAAPFAAEAGAGEFFETYEETKDPLLSAGTGLAGYAVTSLMSQWDGLLRNIEANGMPYIPEVVEKLSSVPGSGALAGATRWGKGFLMWLGNLGKTAVNEAVQEPAENVATTFVTDLIKGKNPLDRDWGEYGRELIAEGVGAAILSLGSSASTMPTYARSVIVAESQMGKSELNASDVQAFVDALKQDMSDPQIVEEAQRRATDIAVEARAGELMAQGALAEVDMSAVVEAEQALVDAEIALTSAVADTDAALKNFDANPADDGAKNQLLSALDAEKKARSAQEAAVKTLDEAQASVQAQSDAVMGAVRVQAEAEVEAALRANEKNRVARESVSGYNEPAGGVMNGEKNRGYDGRGSSGSDAEGRGGNPKRNGLVRRTAVESSAADASRGSLAGVVSRESRGFESFKRATSEGLKGEDGNTLILYHGTGEDFEMLERRDGRNYDTSNGVYLTNSLAVANEYAFRSSNTGKQYIHPVAVNSQKVVYFDGDSFMQNPDYQNYVAKQIEKYNRYADKKGFAEKLDIALAHEVNDGYIDDDIAQAIKDAYALHGRIDVVGVLNTQWNFGMPDSDNQYIVFDPSLLVPATEAYWAEQERDDTGSSSSGGNSDGISRTQVPPQMVRPGNSPTGKLVNPVESAKKLAKTLGVGERIGTRKMNNMPQAVLGYYHNRARYLAVRSRQAGNITVTMHELGHAISQRLGLTGTSGMIANLPAAFAQNYAANELPGEAFAEFMWRYMTDDAEAESFAGAGFIYQFEQALRREGLADAVHTARDEMHAFVNANVNSRIGAMVVDRSKKERSSIKEKFTALLAGLADDTAALEVIDSDLRRRDTPAQNSLRDAALMRNTASRRAWNILTGSMTDSDWNITGDSLATAIERTGMNGRDFDLLNNYMLAVHSLDRDAQGLPVFDASFTTAERQALIADVQTNHPEVAAAAQAVNDWWHEFMQSFMVDTGYLSQETFDRFMQMYPHYVPTNRVKKRGAFRGNGGGSTYTVRRATGSTEEIYNPIDSLVQNVNTIVNMVSQNNVGLVFGSLYNQYDGLGIYARDVTQDMRQDRVNTEGLRDEVEEILTNANTDQDAMEQVLDLIGDEQTQWRMTGNVNLPNVMQVRLPDGTRRFYEFSDNEIFKAITGLKEQHAKSLLDYVGRMTRSMSALTTGSNPLFGIRNFMRDFQKSVNYGSWATGYADGLAKWLRSAYEVWRESGDYEQYKALGGGGWTRIDANTKKGAAEYRGELFRGYNTSNVGRTAKWVGKRLWDTVTLSRLNEIVEQASRFAEYRFGEHDVTTNTGRQEAFLAAQEVTVDFNRAGNSQMAHDLKQLVPFFNASVQGVYQTGREFISEKERGRLPARFAKTVLNTALTSALASALMLKFMDDEDKEEFFWLSDDLKSDHIYIPNVFGGDTPLIRIPLAQDPLARAVHGWVTNMMWSGESADEPAIELAAIANNILDGFNPVSGTVWDPLLAMSTNKNWYGGNIVPTRMQDWHPTTQYTGETASLFVKTGQKTGISPLMLEYLAEQYSGFLGQIVIPAISKDENTGETQGVSAVIAEARKKMTSDPLLSNDITSSFYDSADMLEQIKAAAANDREQFWLNRALTDDEARSAADEAVTMLKTGGVVSDTKKLISEAYDRIDAVNASADLTDHEKYVQTSVIRREMLESVLDANEEIGAYCEKYVNGENILTRLLAAGSVARTSTTYEKLPEVFRSDYDSGASYMSRSYEVWEATGKDGALPKVNTSFSQNKVGYTVAPEMVDEYTSVYQKSYQKAVDGITGWAGMTNDERLGALESAHRKAHDAAKKWYIRTVQ